MLVTKDLAAGLRDRRQRQMVGELAAENWYHFDRLLAVEGKRDGLAQLLSPPVRPVRKRTAFVRRHDCGQHVRRGRSRIVGGKFVLHVAPRIWVALSRVKQAALA